MRKHLTFIVVCIAFFMIAFLLEACNSSGAGNTAAKGTYANIYEAVRADDLAAVKSFLKNGVNVNEKDNEGKTPLHYAAAYASRELVQFLIEQGADINARDGKGRTPMSVAAQMGNSVAEEVLDRAGALE